MLATLGIATVDAGVVAIKFAARIVFVKFIGMHAEYDRIDALTVAQY